MEEALKGKVHYLGLERHALGEQEHHIAMFAFHNVTFALLPCYTGQLGFDPERAYTLLVAESGPNERWDSERESKLHEFATWGLTLPREVMLRPFLIEAQPQSWARTYKVDESATMYLEAASRAEIAQIVEDMGLRFPTSDEWEYAASGGARTLFRWGDTLPPMRSWERPDHREPGAWDLDQRPNAFGLQIAQNPWNLEYCAEPDALRGGDGGTVDCVRPGRAEEWLPLASAFRYHEKPRSRLRRPYVRRALSVPETAWAED